MNISKLIMTEALTRLNKTPSISATIYSNIINIHIKVPRNDDGDGDTFKHIGKIISLDGEIIYQGGNKEITKSFSDPNCITAIIDEINSQKEKTMDASIKWAKRKWPKATNYLNFLHSIS